MEYQDVLKNTKEELKEVTSSFQEDMARVHVGRQSTDLVEDVQVDCYGQKMAIKSLGLVIVTSEKDILIQPWDSSYLESIMKALQDSDLGLSPIKEEKKIRIPTTPLDQEKREVYLKMIGKRAEDARQAVRDVRNSVRKQIENLFAQGGFGKDEKFKLFNDIQEEVKKSNEKIEQVREEKEKEIRRS